MNLKIGSTLYVYDPENRVYEDDRGRKTTISNERFHWREVQITDENNRAWLFSLRGHQHRIDKKSLKCATATILFTEAEVDSAVYVARNSVRLSLLVRDCKDEAKLRAIAAILD